MCPFDNLPCIRHSSLIMPGGPKPNSQGRQLLSKGFPLLFLLAPCYSLPVLNALKEPLSWNGSPLHTKIDLTAKSLVRQPTLTSNTPL